MTIRSGSLALIVWLLGACNGDTVCGPGEAPASGVTAAAQEKVVTFGNLTSSPNNDCSTPGHPTSLTIDGTQTAPTAEAVHITFCLPRPDDISAGADVDLGDNTLVQLIDVFGRVDGCLLRLDSSQPPSGIVRLAGYCQDGLDPAGYAIELDGSTAGTLDCGGDAASPQPVTIQLGGTAAVIAL